MSFDKRCPPWHLIFETALLILVPMFQFITDHGYIQELDIDAGYLVNTKFPNVTLNKQCGGKNMIYGVCEFVLTPDDASLIRALPRLGERVQLRRGQ